VGEQLSAPLRIFRPPRWTLRQGAIFPPAPSSRSNLGAFTDDPGHSRGQGRGGSKELFAAFSFSRFRYDAPL